MDISTQMDNRFEFNTQVLRAETVDGKMYLVGVASSTNKDQHMTIFSDECQRGFVADVMNKENPIVIDIKHSNNFMDFIGRVESAQVREEQDTTYFEVKILLNERSSEAKRIYEIIREPLTEFGEPNQLGLSIMGTAKQWHLNEDGITVFDRVQLKRIAITDMPSNVDTFINVLERSIKENMSKNEGQEVEKTTQENEIVVEEVKKVVQEETQRELEFDDKWKIKASSIRMSVNEQVDKMIKSISAVQASSLDADMLLVAVKEFVDYFEDEFESMCERVEWNGVVEDESVAREKNKDKSNLIEKIIVERQKMTEENQEAIAPQETPSVKQQEEVSRETTQEPSVEVKDESNELLRSILESVQKLTEKVNAIESKQEEVAREVKEVKEKPMTSPTLPQEVIERQAPKTRSAGELLRSAFNIR